MLVHARKGRGTVQGLEEKRAKVPWVLEEVSLYETSYTYSPRFERAARATRGADVHAGRLPWACGVNGAPWSTPGVRVARFGACAPHGPRHRAAL